ncbi:ketopantoate reductase family protein [Sphingobium sp.]|uniref:ketopantoate reductase family protein n=1 Tax=Sphingobium sp. TaxID=1912891 RepID=UPI003BB7274A
MTTASGEGDRVSPRIVIFGAGAVGSVVAARLAQAGKPFHLVARGDRLDRLRVDGLLLRNGDGDTLRYDVATAAPWEGTPQDIVFLALKGQAIPAALPDLGTWIGPDTVVVPLVNGIPWWYFQPHGTRSVGAVDPQAHVSAAIDPHHVVGAVLYLTASLARNGVASMQGREHIVMGPIAAWDDAVTEQLRTLFDGTPISIDLVPDIRRDMWSKVALNIATNPLSVVADATLHDQFHDEGLARLVANVLGEVIGLARAYQVEPRLSLEQMLAKGRQAGHVYTSMAQDYANGLPLELGAIAHSVLELADHVGFDMANTRMMVDLCTFRAAQQARVSAI